ncbi:hypothetical protein NOF04DRAFT_6932 [Fusarium oxysporum II5]|uniref:Uncharacterized protein n=2 Tax=Fusarium oxysporum species complex TaxID=171631 RepID=X0JMV4_FUSO5|nr:uncharacterized protein FOIG_10064 [Fusarium odoratissimum NRRL 54006]EXL97741.1 hypothetical protein FOIG_10064 [Fusarium odoratissimum NRRL 54006]KAK2122707.1 hypothetical protein NOF04DRAFT_6932 [Fusarium oxysporum II5]TXB96825.1 hypothetical protein FocTR4_00011271 [Fusarium oxysporum f. sp. cubense]
MPFPCKCPRESRDKWIHVGIPVVERTWGNTCHQGLLNRRGFQAAYNRVAIPELLECLKQENHSGSENREILPSSCSRKSQVKQQRHPLHQPPSPFDFSTGQQFGLPPVASNSLVAQRDVGFGNPNGFGRFDPRRSAGGLSLGSSMIKSPALLKDRPA